MTRNHRLVACVCLASATLTCNLREPQPGPVAESGAALEAVEASRGRFQLAPAKLRQTGSISPHSAIAVSRSAIRAPVASRVLYQEKFLVGEFEGNKGADSPAAELPLVASDPFILSHGQSGISVGVQLRGVGRATAEVAKGDVIYRGARADGGDLFHRLTPTGTEDYITYVKEPALPEEKYEIALGDEVAGLRLVANTLEFLDRGGAPRLRISPPYLVGADGVTHPVHVAVFGCLVDTNPAAPWGRPLTPAGAKRCVVALSWNREGVTYPALLDPAWTQTSSNMNAIRAEHTATLLADGTVLVAGGLDPGVSVTASADIYDPTTNSFAATGSMSQSRFAHTATLLPNGDVLVVGGETTCTGANPYCVVGKTERYHAGTWLQTEPDAPTLGGLAQLSRHSASLIEQGTQGGKVLIVGGEFFNTGTGLQESTTQVLLYDPAGAGPGSFTAATSLPTGREAHAQVTESGGHRVLIAQGFQFNLPSAPTYYTSALEYDADTNSWADAGDTGTTGGSSDGPPPMVQIPSGASAGQVLLMGLASASLHTFGSSAAWTGAGTPTFNHEFGAAAAMSNGTVLLTGGVDDLKAELWTSPSTWSTQTDMLFHRGDHKATPIGTPTGSEILLTGGTAFDGASTNTAEVFTNPPAANGSSCNSPTECTSTFCVGGICCGSACNPPNTVTSCSTGTCTFISCASGWRFCDGSPTDVNGCESQIDSSSCTACGVPCPPPPTNGSSFCNVFPTPSCGFSCFASFPTYCSGSNACVDTTNDTNHCGACNNVCSAQNSSSVCSGGVCGHGMCNAGFGDCDGSAADGCETNANTSTANCGACGNVCSAQNSSSVCSGGACGHGICNVGFGDCDGSAADGCESPLNTPTNCLACNTSCVGQIANLIALTRSFHLRPGIAITLEVELVLAEVALDVAPRLGLPVACNLLGAFTHDAQAQSGKALTVSQANQLISSAGQIRAVLGCR